ncbi:MAG: DNA alkylation repair protein [Chloroflexi bacterium]|nr:MAG: DNA alkylation repair protein [Chloroflexota bacterium]
MTVFTCTTSAATNSSGLTSSVSRSSQSFTEARATGLAAIAAAIDVELRRHRNPSRAPAEKAYLKSDLEFLGVGLPTMRQIIRVVKRQHAGLDRRRLVSLVGILWKLPVFERRMVAVLLLEAFQPLLRPGDIAQLERLIRQSKTWAFVDELAIVIVGPLVERSPELLRILDRWAHDEDFWKAYLKSDLDLLGVSLPDMRQMVRAITREATARRRLPLAIAALRRRFRRHRARRREVPFAATAGRAAGRLSAAKAPGTGFLPRTSMKAGNSRSRCASLPGSASGSGGPGENSQIPSTTMPPATIPLTMVSKRWPNSMVGATSFLFPSVQVMSHSLT